MLDKNLQLGQSHYKSIEQKFWKAYHSIVKEKRHSYKLPQEGNKLTFDSIL